MPDAGTVRKKPSFLGGFIKAVALVLIGAVVAPIVGGAWEQYKENPQLELRIVKTDPAFAYPQTVNNNIKVTIDGKEYPNIAYLDVELYNRTQRNFKSLPVHMALTNVKSSLIHKILLVPHGEPLGYLHWKSLTESAADLEFDKFNIRWDGEAAVTARFYYETGALPDVEISTSEPGVSFVPFDSERQVWWLFGTEKYIVKIAPLLAIFGALLLLVIIARAVKVHDAKVAAAAQPSSTAGQAKGAENK